MDKCKALTAKGTQCTRHIHEGTYCKIHQDRIDNYTEEILRESFSIHKKYVLERMEIKSRGLAIRLPNMPEDISENITKFIIHFHNGDTTSQWIKAIKGKAGDLISKIENIQEVKGITSDGPISFGPREKWDVIYFLDCRKWLDDQFILWRLPLTNTSDTWKKINVNSTETIEHQNEQGRRPRIIWNSLYEKIKDHCTKIFEGSFDDIFKTVKVPVFEQSTSPPEQIPHSQPTYTSDNLQS